MRQKRAKSYKKQMLVYNYAFKFREPYQVLIDDQLVSDCQRSHYDLVGGLKRTLQAEVKPMITQCCIQALYSTRNQDAIELGKSFERRRCNHPPKEARSPNECIESVVNVNGSNKHRYVVASQDISMRRKLRKIPGVPLVHMSRSVMVMEPLSEASSHVNEVTEREKLLKGLNDPKMAGLKASSIEDYPENQPPAKKRKGPKGPNPLSVKKKQKKPEQGEGNGQEQDRGQEHENDGKTKRRRRRRHKSSQGNIDGQEDSAEEVETQGHPQH
ncbi:small subunit processome component [Zygosaccharomyces mellis]|uniref:U three protein 23 n=1 Tax=Zygosaccharomyces mellis TaxID=42258 RepID=A0A4C2E5K3_9SACH|nr:small subunit processome component [Zygosaccharomyces mellis]